MSTPKIKVYRLEKGYNRDSDNDIQSKVNSELLPFIQKKTKSTDAYYLTGISEQKIQWNGKKINTNPHYYLEKDENGEYIIDDETKQYVPINLFTSTNEPLKTDYINGYPDAENIGSGHEIENWIKDGYYKPRLGYFEYTEENGVVIKRTFKELERNGRNEADIMDDIKKVRSGEVVNKNYFTIEDFIYAHPFLYSKSIEDAPAPEDRPIYNEKYYIKNEDTGDYEVIEKDDAKYIQVSIDELSVKDVFDTDDMSMSTYTIRYYLEDENSKTLLLEDYPIYDHKNYYYKPQLFNSKTEKLNFDEKRNSQTIECGNEWIFNGAGEPIVTFDEKILKESRGGEGDYEMFYTYDKTTEKRTLYIKLSEECYSKKGEKTEIILHYNTDYNTDNNTEASLIPETDYTIDSDSGLITFNDGVPVPENLFIYYRKKLQNTAIYASEYPNWSFGHLRENPDIFFGEKDYPGDESEDENGTPLFGGLKPSFVSEGYQIDYFRGTVNFIDGNRVTYRSEASNREERDISTPETFVRANFSYYPEIHNVFRQKMERVNKDDTEGFIYQPVNDKRFGNSIGKRWIMKNDDYQPMFFQSFTDGINTASQYLTTVPNPDVLSKKSIVEINNTNDISSNNENLHFILPMIESKFFTFKIYETGQAPNNKDTVWNTLNHTITFKSLMSEKNEDGSDKFEEVESFDLVETNGVFTLNGIELKPFSEPTDDERNSTSETDFGITVVKGEKVKVMISYLNTYTQVGVKSISFQLISAEV